SGHLGHLHSPYWVVACNVNPPSLMSETSATRGFS
ncbi:MAG: hypothetical protein ACI8W7_004847, partial [Gammaproteobacteria bacterium]